METTVNEIVPNVKSEPNTTLQNKHPPTTKPQVSTFTCTVLDNTCQSL